MNWWPSTNQISSAKRDWPNLPRIFESPNCRFTENAEAVKSRPECGLQRTVCGQMSRIRTLGVYCTACRFAAYPGESAIRKQAGRLDPWLMPDSSGVWHPQCSALRRSAARRVILVLEIVPWLSAEMSFATTQGNNDSHNDDYRQSARHAPGSRRGCTPLDENNLGRDHLCSRSDTFDFCLCLVPNAEWPGGGALKQAGRDSMVSRDRLGLRDTCCNRTSIRRCVHSRKRGSGNNDLPSAALFLGHAR